MLKPFEPLPPAASARGAAPARRRRLLLEARLKESVMPDFCMQLAKLFLSTDMTQVEFADHLSERTGFKITQVRLANWLNGALPRAGRGERNVEDAVLKAADELAREARAGHLRPRTGPDRYVPIKTVQAQLQHWSRMGITDHQIWIAGEISQTSFLTWKNGTTRPTRKLWNAFTMKVAAWADFLKEKNKVWAAEARAQARAAMARKKKMRPKARSPKRKRS